MNNFEEELKPNRILYIELTVTKDSEIGKALATHLSQLACEHAHRTQGFCYAYVQVTHHATKHIFLKKFNSTIVAQIDPTTWVWKRGGNIMPYKQWTIGSISSILFSLHESER